NVNGGVVSDSATQAATGRATYLVLLAMSTAVTLGYFCVKIFPAYRKIFADFRRQVPSSTLSMVSKAEDVAYSQFTGLLVLTIVAVFIYVVGRYCGLIQWDAPILRRFTIKLDQALIMRALAECVVRQQPIPRMLDALAEQYPKAHI